MSGMDVLRERIARALWEHRYPGVEQAGPLADLALTDADAVIAALGLVEDAGDVSDGYHTFRELYEYRMLYNAAWLNLSAQHNEHTPADAADRLRRYVTPWERIEDDQ